MTRAGFESRGSRWFSTSRELCWVFELDRGSSWAKLGMLVGVGVRAWLPGNGVARANDGHLYIEYPLLGSAVPPEAIGTRFDDHGSYFTMAFDHAHDLVSEEERRRAFDFMAADLAELVNRCSTEEELRSAVAAGTFDSGYVDPRLR